MSPAKTPRGTRVVVDTSVLIAGVRAFRQSYIRGKNASADILYGWLVARAFLWLVSAETLEEYKEVMHRKGVPIHVAGRLVNLLQEEAVLIVAHPRGPISPDARDDCFCWCAEDGGAQFLVTLNPRDFPQDRLSARVVAPQEFLALRRNLFARPRK